MIAKSLLLASTVGVTIAQAGLSCSNPFAFLSHLVFNEVETRLSISPATLETGEYGRISATVTSSADTITDREFLWFVDGALVTSGESDVIDVAFDSAGQHLVEVTVLVAFANAESVTDEAALYVTVEAASTTTPPTGADDGTPANVEISISGPDELRVGESGAYSATASGSATIAWDLLGDGTLGSAAGASTTVTATASGFLSLVAEARDPTTGAVLATQTYSIGVSSPYRIYITPQICGDGQLELRSEEAVANGIELCSIDGGGNDCSIMADLTPVSEAFDTPEEAADWLCSQTSDIYYHYYAGYIGTYSGAARCLGASVVGYMTCLPD